MRILVTLAAAFFFLQAAFGQEYKYTDAQKLTVVGKMIPTTNPYHRIDSGKYPGMTAEETGQSCHCAGIAIAFKTDSD